MNADIFDPSELSFDDWLNYFFGRPVESMPSGKETWYHGLVEARDNAKVLHYLQQFNTQFSDIHKRFSMDQIGQGLWVLFAYGTEAGRLFVAPEVPLALRLQVLGSFETLYREAVKGFKGDIRNGAQGQDTDPMGAFYMLWDLLLSEMYRSGRVLPPAELNAVETKCEETLVRILAIGDKACDVCALHGLEHLRTPRSKALIGQYLQQHPELTSDEQRWVEGCYRNHV
jgi:hypothetical protein